jgi:hypothetical protein
LRTIEWVLRAEINHRNTLLRVSVDGDFFLDILLAEAVQKILAARLLRARHGFLWVVEEVACNGTDLSLLLLRRRLLRGLGWCREHPGAGGDAGIRLAQT